jgi:hypothetical protein
MHSNGRLCTVAGGKGTLKFQRGKDPIYLSSYLDSHLSKSVAWVMKVDLRKGSS